MKRLLSLLLSAVVFTNLIMGANIIAFAGGWSNNAIKVQYDTVYTAEPSKLDAGEHINDMGVTIDRYFDAFKFTVPIKGKITLNMEAASKYYLPLDWESCIDYIIYSDKNIDKELDVDYTIVNAGFSSARNIYYGKYTWNLPAGTYYLLFQYSYNPYWGFSQEGSCEFSLSYKPDLAKPSNLKVSSRKTTSLKFKWSKVSGASGYQLQRKSGNTWKTLKNTTSTSYTVKKLSAGKVQYFRVRAYKTVSGKKYYSSWKTLTTATNPSSPSIKTPSTNKKHQIIAKWKKVSSCSGYQVQYSKKSNFKKIIATKTVSGKSKTSYTGRNFTKRKKYYVRVRSYKTVNGTKYYSSWSKVKSIKCK